MILPSPGTRTQKKRHPRWNHFQSFWFSNYPYIVLQRDKKLLCYYLKRSTHQKTRIFFANNSSSCSCANNSRSCSCKTTPVYWVKKEEEQEEGKHDSIFCYTDRTILVLVLCSVAAVKLYRWTSIQRSNYFKLYTSFWFGRYSYTVVFLFLVTSLVALEESLYYCTSREQIKICLHDFADSIGKGWSYAGKASEHSRRHGIIVCFLLSKKKQ